MSIIPAPLSQQVLPGQYILPSEALLTFDCEELKGIASQAAEELRRRYGVQARAQLVDAGSGAGTVHFSRQVPLDALRSDIPHPDEAYELTVTPGSVTVVGAAPAGVFYGLQSLLMLLPPLPPPEGQDIAISATKVIDGPRFQWRGVLLDVGRHFFSVKFLKRFLDVLAMHKIKIFHWHLTEDQGWRPEVKQLERLTTISPWRTHDGGASFYGGFYTQEEMKDIVAYAADRYIHVMPEIELPGHSCAALAAYPELSCSGQQTEVPNKWGVHENIYCAGNDDVFKFLETILEEMTEIFPFEYFHIGGDEAPKAQWKLCPKCQERMRKENLEHEGVLQSWFIQRVSNFLASKGKKIVGWDEILEGGLVEGATVMSWRGTSGGEAAAKMGHKAIMTPTNHCYFDYKQSTSANEPGCWYAMLEIETVYSFDPCPSIKESSSAAAEAAGSGRSSREEGREEEAAFVAEGLSEVDQSNILGGQANLWTEYVGDEATAEYMLLPRLSAMSEALWSPRENKSWEDFRRRLVDLTKHFDALGLNYRSLEDPLAPVYGDGWQKVAAGSPGMEEEQQDEQEDLRGMDEEEHEEGEEEEDDSAAMEEEE